MAWLNKVVPISQKSRLSICYHSSRLTALSSAKCRSIVSSTKVQSHTGAFLIGRNCGEIGFRE